ncbi:GerAB/ArcD/ProY family transporter [Cytobacillus kochii]|uniref:GerAB/ArcD/ProY family transporter n=1 Tax=Cytobacillus kochii TaxID=859143 RepID=UPI0025A25623|nr:endospore germination permease [Cytobacillus kochii]MDM5206214.1 endospore germination permease [Cytobacillus kochii]
MKFSRLQLAFIIILFIGISNHVLILPHLLGLAKRDAWLSVLIAYGIMFVWIFLYQLILSKNKEGEHTFIWLKKRVGNFVAYSIMSLFLLYFSVAGLVSFFDLIQSVHIFFLPFTPIWIVALPFILLCVWAASSGIKTIIYTSTILLPFVWGLGMFVAIATLEEKDYSYLLPLFADKDASVIEGVIIVLGGSVDLLIFFIIHHYFEKKIPYWYLMLLLTVLTILIMGPTIGSLTSFGPSMAANMRFPAFEQWRLVSIGDLISHVDALAVFQLLSGVTIRVSLCLFLIPEILHIQKKWWKVILITLTALILYGIVSLQTSDIIVFHIIKHYFYKVSLSFGVFMTLILLFVSYLPSRKGEKEYDRGKSI